MDLKEGAVLGIIFALTFALMGIVYNSLSSDISHVDEGLTRVNEEVEALRNQIDSLQTWLFLREVGNEVEYEKTENLKGIDASVKVNSAYMSENWIGFPISINRRIAEENLLRFLFEKDFKTSIFQDLGKKPKLVITDTQNLRLIFPTDNLKLASEKLEIFFRWIEMEFSQ